jgi:hypothetical protein
VDSLTLLAYTSTAGDVGARCSTETYVLTVGGVTSLFLRHPVKESAEIKIPPKPSFTLLKEKFIMICFNREFPNF